MTMPKKNFLKAAFLTVAASAALSGCAVYEPYGYGPHRGYNPGPIPYITTVPAPIIIVDPHHRGHEQHRFEPRRRNW
ncbi:MAG: hypothetical protein PW788_12610 [Micavibrio sp.]|nr:hypothetical protein [Micavibrio sp.]